MQRAGEVADFVGGFVAGEGSFTNSGQRFAFSVGLGASDRSMCDLLRLLLGVGSITFFARRQSHYDDEVTYIVQAMGDLVEVVVPFMDEHLPASYKRQQYEAWRRRLQEYWDNEAKRRRPCTVEGCAEPQRAKGVCRRHYYLQYGG